MLNFGVYLGGGFKYFFSPLSDEHIFQMGWFNHQADVVLEDMSVFTMIMKKALLVNGVFHTSSADLKSPGLQLLNIITRSMKQKSA